MTTDVNPAPSPESEEAAWELATAERLRAQGDFAGAASWYRRAAEHLMDAGDDDQALDVAKKAAELAALEPIARPSPAVHAVPPPPPPAAMAPPEVIPPTLLESVPPPQPFAPAASAIPGPMHTEPSVPAATTAVAHPPQHFMVPLPRGTAGPRPPAATHHAPLAALAPLARHTPARPTPHTPHPPHAEPAVHAEPPAPRAEPPAVHAPEEHPVAAPEVPPPAPTHAPPPAPAPTHAAPKHARRPRAYLSERVAEIEIIATKLPALPLFGELPDESIRALARQTTLVRYTRGEVIADGAGGEGPLLVLTEGDAEAKAAPEQPGVPLGAGDFAGELAAYYGGSRVVTVVAQSRVEAVALAPSLVRATARDFESFREALEDTIWEWAFASLPWMAPLLRRLDPEARTAVFNRFEQVNLREGDVLQSEGVKPGAVWLVAAGEVEVYGGELGAAAGIRARAGDALGVGAVLADEVSGVSARAVRGVLAARITADAFRSVVGEQPTLGASVADIGVTGRGVMS